MRDYDSRFDDIRPYTDDEVGPAMRRIASNDFFAMLSSYIFPDRKVEDVRGMVAGLKTTYDFQHEVMWWVNERIRRGTIDELTYSGVQDIDRTAPHLYVSNHRDIMLDASLLQNILAANDLDTTEITFGANLMSSPLIVDIGRSNKMFRVERATTTREFYEKSMHLSDYIRYLLTEKGESVWIAQRNGRTKDGDDRTDQGIVKMFGMSGAGDKVGDLDALRIVPVAVSYEWEPCDVLKSLELYQSRQEKYVKKPGEDLSSILQGIRDRKGRVHFSVCKGLGREELEAYGSLTRIEFNRSVAALIDSRVYSGYRLWPNNFIAHDLRFGQRRWDGRYTDAQREAFLGRMHLLDAYDVEEPDVLRDIFLSIYANPVENCLK